MTNLCILTGSRAASNIITNRARALTARRADRRVDARLTTKSISQHPADIRNESSVPELSLDHAARALCYTWRSGPFFGLDNSRVTATLKIDGELVECDREFVQAYDVIGDTARAYWPMDLVEPFVRQNWYVVSRPAFAC